MHGVKGTQCQEQRGQCRIAATLPTQRDVQERHGADSQPHRHRAADLIQRPQSHRKARGVGDLPTDEGRYAHKVDVECSVAEEVRVPVSLGEAERREKQEDLIRVVGEVVGGAGQPP